MTYQSPGGQRSAFMIRDLSMAARSLLLEADGGGGGSSSSSSSGGGGGGDGGSCT